MDILIDTLVPILLEKHGRLPGPRGHAGQGCQQFDCRLQMRHVKVDADHPHRPPVLAQHRADRFEPTAIEVHLFIGAYQRDIGPKVDLVQQ